MEQIIIYVGLALVGLMIGSFNGATVWRLRARQLKEDKAAGEAIDKKEYDHLKKLLGKSVQKDRSVCLHCHHQLQWYDLIPLVSWLMLRGKCRYCKKTIGGFEPLVELGTAAFFVVSYLVWPHELTNGLALAQFGLWLAAGVGLIILFCYDMKWFLLPDEVMWPVIGLAALSASLVVIGAPVPLEAFWSVIGSCLVLSGIYLFLYVASKGAWIGFGDIKLGLALGLLLADWQLALLALFLANLVGSLIVVPAMLVGRLGRASRIPFGPLLIVGWLIAGLWGSNIIAWYLAVPLGI